MNHTSVFQICYNTSEMPQPLSECSPNPASRVLRDFPASGPRNDRTRNRCVRVDVAALPDLTSKGRNKVIQLSCDGFSKLISHKATGWLPYVPILRTQKCLINLWGTWWRFSRHVFLWKWIFCIEMQIAEQTGRAMARCEVETSMASTALTISESCRAIFKWLKKKKRANVQSADYINSVTCTDQ
jgi:hypothetical protein